jgi:hypothetical protein
MSSAIRYWFSIRSEEVRSNNRIYLNLTWIVIVLAVLTWVLAVSFASETKPQQENGNTKCYVCHPSLKTEDVTMQHLEMGITCDECHGPSVEHMHDEMLMTEPDLLFGRSEVQKMCSNPTCHKPGPGRLIYGLQDHKDIDAVKEFHDKWMGRTRPNGRAVTTDSVCTDCHGTHNLDKAIDTRFEQEQPLEWINAFNGRNLSGFQTSGDSCWTVKQGRIIAAPGPNGKGGDLWTSAEYENYRLALTFRATWPIHAGIWLRAATKKLGPRIEIFDKRESSAFTGSLWIPEKRLALVNLRDNLVDRESWNTISVKVEGNRIQIWLNGEEVGAVHADAPPKGRIGLHLHQDQPSKAVEWSIREMLIQPLTEGDKQ